MCIGAMLEELESAAPGIDISLEELLGRYFPEFVWDCINGEITVSPKKV